MAITTYRIVQECLTNVTKHSKARLVTIKVELQAGRLKLLVKDNGQGFDHTLNTQGFGLAGMRERVEGLSGSFNLNTKPTAGVEIQVSLPMMLRAGI